MVINRNSLELARIINTKFSGRQNVIEYRSNKSKRHKGRNLQLVIKLFLFSIFATLISCNEPVTNRTSNSLSSNESSVSESPSEGFEAKDPETGSFVNFFQINTMQYKANFEISEKEQRIFYLRGQEVSEYLKSVDRKNPACLSVAFTEETLKKVLLLSGSPQSYFDFTQGTLEYYYSFEPANTQKNKSNCQTSDIINQRLLSYSDHQIVFDLLSICENCGLEEIKSRKLMLENTNGINISSINIPNLLMTLKADPGGEIFSGSSCKKNSECRSRGFDCCSGGICVVDKAPRPGVAEVDPFSGEIIKFLIPE